MPGACYVRDLQGAAGPVSAETGASRATDSIPNLFGSGGSPFRGPRGVWSDGDKRALGQARKIQNAFDTYLFVWGLTPFT